MSGPSPEFAITPNDAGMAARKLIFACNHGQGVTLTRSEAVAFVCHIEEVPLLEMAGWENTTAEVGNG